MCIDKIMTLLGDSSVNYNVQQIITIFDLTKAEIEAYCNRELDKDLEAVAVQMCVIKLNRLGSEGLSAESYSGINQNYIDGYPANLKAILNRKRRIKVL